MKVLNDLDIDLLSQRERGRLMNSLSGFKSANVIGTTDGSGGHNLAMISSVVHLGSDPALLGFVLRPPGDPAQGSHTYWNIRETNVFTINHVSSDWYRAAHQTSARYPLEESEFDAVGLTPIFRCGFEAPAVEESRVRIGLERAEEWKIPQNECRFIVGRIRWVEFPEEAWKADGFLDLEMLDGVALSSLDSYHSTQKLERLTYAKKDEPLRAVDAASDSPR